MIRKLLQASALVTAAALIPQPADAEPMCGDRDELTARLASQYGEVLQGSAAASPTSFYEILGSRDTGTWTVLLSGNNGYSCIISSGQDGRAVSAVLEARDGWPQPGGAYVR
jgi:hypothetical protein